MKKNNKQKIVKTLAVLILLPVIVFSGWKIWSIESAYKKSGDAYEEAASFVTIPEKEENEEPEEQLPEQTPEQSEEPEAEAEEEEEEQIDWPEVDFDALLEINSDIVGWIYIEDTKINYPITRGEDNVYYSYHMWNKVYDGFGCIFMDYRNRRDFSDQNSVLYGHHMQNGTMFQNLHGYKKQDFYDTHKTAYLLTPYKNYRLEIFAAYVVSLAEDAWKTDFAEGEFEPWYMNAVERSCIETGIVPTPKDKIVTLSTCSYEWEEARFVVLGILK